MNCEYSLNVISVCILLFLGFLYMRDQKQKQEGVRGRFLNHYVGFSSLNSASIEECFWGKAYWEMRKIVLFDRLSSEQKMYKYYHEAGHIALNDIFGRLENKAEEEAMADIVSFATLCAKGCLPETLHYSFLECAEPENTRLTLKQVTACLQVAHLFATCGIPPHAQECAPRTDQEMIDGFKD